MAQRSSKVNNRRKRVHYLRNFGTGFLGLILLTSLFLWPVEIDPEQPEEPISASIRFDPDMNNNLDSLTFLYGKNKELPKGFEVQSLLALSRYPELRETRISFKVSPALIPVASRPDFWSLLKGRQNQAYNVWISSRSRMVPDEVLLDKLPFNAQISLLAHELGHTCYYDRLSRTEFIKFGACYLISSGFRARHERSTDRLVIQRGLGEGLLENARFVREHPATSEFFSEEGNFLDAYYLTPDEIVQILNAGR